MARPSLGRLLWASNSAQPHHVDGSRGTTWPEKMIYSKVSTVSPDPHGKVPDLEMSMGTRYPPTRGEFPY
jgi:hypothetical protein